MTNGCPFLTPPHFHCSCIRVSKHYMCIGIPGTYVGFGSNPVDGCRENEEPDDGNHGRSRSKLEVFVHIFPLRYHLQSGELYGFERWMLTMIFHRSIAGSCYGFPEVEWVSQMTSWIECRHTLTYPMRILSIEPQDLESRESYRVHPWLV